MNEITQVYNKYEHLDELLCDKSWLPDDSVGAILYDLWRAIRSANEPVGIQIRPSEGDTPPPF